MANFWSIFLGLLGIALTLLVGKGKPWAIITVISIIAVVALVTLVRSFKLKGLFVWLKVRRELGIYGIYRRGYERNNEKGKRISNSRNLKIMATSAETLIRIFKEFIVTALTENNCNVQVLMAKEGSDFVREIENLESSYRGGQISEEIKHTRSRLQEILDSAREKRKHQPIGHIWITPYNTELRVSLIICDDSWGWCTLNLAPKRTIETPSLELERVPNGLLDDCIRYFDAVWNAYKDQCKEVV